MATVFHTAVSLDGFLTDESGDYSWVYTYRQEPRGLLAYDEFVKHAGVIVMGATCFSQLSEAVTSGLMAWPYAVPVFVFTHRSHPVPEGADLRFVEGDVAGHWEDIEEASGGKDVWVFGGGELAVQTAEAGFLEEIVVNVAPLTLAVGAALFPRPAKLKLLEAGINGDFAVARYSFEGFSS